jgi:hypothetical protein
MDKGQAENFGFEIDAIAGETIRQREAYEVIQQLDSLFYPSETSTPTPLNAILAKVPGNVGVFVSGTIFSADRTTSEISEPYESFTHEGQDYESRIVKLEVPEPEGLTNLYVGGKVYLLCLVGKGQMSINRDNFRWGVVQTSRNEILFFSYEGDDKGPLIELVKPLEPAEQYQVVNEFRKALDKLEPKTN